MADGKNPLPMDCESCVYYRYDEELDADVCDLSLDEDEQVALLQSKSAYCRYFVRYDEYGTVRKQN